MKPNRSTRNALVRMRAAYLDLQSAKRYTEANDLLELIERIEPPSATDGEAVARTAFYIDEVHEMTDEQLTEAARVGATFSANGRVVGAQHCQNCDKTLAAHCTVHLLPCCPGSLMHGQDEGTWTPTSLDPA